jgi:hypothetical protein
MSKISKEIISDLESGIENTTLFEFGTPELNDVYKKLQETIKEEFDKITNKDTKIDILKKMSDPEIQIVYKGLNSVDKIKIDKLKLRDKFQLLSQLAKKRKEIKETPTKTTDQEKSVTELPKQNVIVVEKEKTLPIEKERGEEPTDLDNEEAPEEEGHEEQAPEEKKTENKKEDAKTLQQRFDNIIRTFYSANPFTKNTASTPELEVRFGTKGKILTKNDYDNVIKKLKSSGFYSKNNSGEYYLRMNSEFMDVDGRIKISDNIRTEIMGIHNIQSYCKNNDLKEIIKLNFTSVSFIKKAQVYINDKRVFPVDIDDFNFRVSYANELQVKTGVKNGIVDKWKTYKKQVRFINRVKFVNDNYPFIIDISIVKYGNRNPDKFGRPNRGQIIPTHTLEQSNVFNNDETYEIEIEIDNNSIGPYTKFNTPELIATALRNVIKNILGGLQGTNFPISYPEQNQTRIDYMKMIWNKEYDEKKPIKSRYFIGPSSITLQMINLASNNDNTNEPNIRKDFVVTEKADGDRHLMYINKEGRIYLINTSMDIIFTGARTMNKECFETILDGELILHDKAGKFINLYAAFDIYYLNKVDIRDYSFMILPNEMENFKSRYELLKKTITHLNPVSILDEGKKEVKSAKELLQKYTSSLSIASPIRIMCKQFFPLNEKKQSIFNACDIILTKARENRFEYETDGLIFTHAYFGVGSEKIGEAGPKTKITWRQSFKWKPPKYNTIDFLVTTIKGPNGDDTVKPIFEDGTNADLSTQLTEYKIIELRCGFSEKDDGYINPCQDIIDDKLPVFKQRFEDKPENDYLPKRFYPTEPYDTKAGLCNIMLKLDGSGTKKMFTEENQVFEDNTIVEFSYDFDRKDGWRWVPLRVRYDKTAEYRKGEKQYGNSYKTANENWKSIHNPITEVILCSGLNIPDILISEDVYYNKPSGKFMTEAMKNFHNLYVKKLLITSVSKKGDILIDFACGKAGDLSKWIAAGLSFVYGIDYSKENLENRLDGCCARYLKARKSNKQAPYALFVHGNSAYNVKKGEAMLNDKAKQITGAIFGRGPKDADKIGAGVARQYGIGEDGFNVSSCQFALHYFFESPDTLQGFVRNLAECTKLNGYFIGTAYDGKEIFNKLKKVKTNESIKIIENGAKIWEITKRYGATNFDDDSSCIGYKIDVYQESINQTIPEYLINFYYFDRIMDAYGFKPITRIEAQEIGLPEGSGLFSELFVNMIEEIKRNKFKEKDYGNAANMTEFEKTISFLNRYFIYKKVIEVNTEKVQIELGEYDESEVQRNDNESQQVEIVAKNENKKLKPKVRKLSKKLLLVAATEAVEEEHEQPVGQPVKKVVKKIKPKKVNAEFVLEKDD